MTPEEQAIRSLHTRWIDAVNAGDLACLLDLMTDDVVFLSPGRAPFARDGFTDGFTSGHRDFLIRCTSELENVVAASDVAYTVCRDALRVTPRTGGDTVELAGHRLTVYRRQPDGRWLLARDAHTLSPVGS